jgi:predicted PP-loop superfamily ATPase
VTKVIKTVAAQALEELSDFGAKMLRGQEMLTRIKDEDVQISTAVSGGVEALKDGGARLSETINNKGAPRAPL